MAARHENSPRARGSRRHISGYGDQMAGDLFPWRKATRAVRSKQATRRKCSRRRARGPRSRLEDPTKSLNGTKVRMFTHWWRGCEFLVGIKPDWCTPTGLRSKTRLSNNVNALRPHSVQLTLTTDYVSVRSFARDDLKPFNTIRGGQQKVLCAAPMGPRCANTPRKRVRERERERDSLRTLVFHSLVEIKILLGLRPLYSIFERREILRFSEEKKEIYNDRRTYLFIPLFSNKALPSRSHSVVSFS